MQKRKLIKKDKVAKIDTDSTASEFFDFMAEEMSPLFSASVGIESAMGDMITAVMQSSMELTKLVIENRVRNTDHMIDDDIYEIHKKSVQALKDAMDNIGE